MLQVASDLKSCEAKVIHCLQEVDRFLVHRFVGYNSLYQYALHSLKLTEHQAYTYICVARKSAELPELQAAIESGDLSVSKARRVTAVITAEKSNRVGGAGKDGHQKAT